MHNSSDNEKPNPMILISNGLVIEKQVKKKNNADKKERRFGIILTVIIKYFELENARLHRNVALSCPRCFLLVSESNNCFIIHSK